MLDSQGQVVAAWFTVDKLLNSTLGPINTGISDSYGGQTTRVCNQPAPTHQPGYPSVGRQNEYQR